MAATGVVSGRDATLTFATGYTAGIKNWTIEFETDDIDTTELGDDWESSINGVKRWSGTYECDVNSSSFGTVGDTGFDEAAASATFIFDNPASTKGSLSGTIRISRGSMTTQVGGNAATRITFSFTGSDALTFTKAA